MATRKKDWSLTDRLLQGSRDSVDRQGRFPLRHHATPPRTANPMAASARGFSTPILHGGYPSSSPRTANPAALASVRGPNSRQGQPSSSKPAAGASPDRLRERTRSRYNEETYSQPDLSGLGLGETKSGWPTPTPARKIAIDPSWRPGTAQFDNPDIPTRRMVNAGFKPSPERRQASTESAFRAADASMFNSTVTPKAAPIRDYKPRGKVTKDKNIQAFY